MRRNKKGAEKLISIYWFVILGLVGAAVIWMVAIFYGEPYDIREIEVGLLSDKAADCVSYAGYLREGILTPISGFQESFLDRCNINFGNEQNEYFLKLEFYDFDQTVNPLLEVSEGNINLIYFCELEGESNPICLEREIYTLDKKGNSYMVKIISIIAKEKNA